MMEKFLNDESCRKRISDIISRSQELVTLETVAKKIKGYYPLGSTRPILVETWEVQSPNIAIDLTPDTRAESDKKCSCVGQVQSEGCEGSNPNVEQEYTDLGKDENLSNQEVASPNGSNKRSSGEC